MPPHCDTMDGPVVKAARAALEAENVNLILPWAPKKAEAELNKAFEKTIRARKMGNEAKEVADYWFFETVVRLHREGEGEPYTGLKPAGLDEGPVVLGAEKAIESGDVSEVSQYICHTAEEQLARRLDHAISLRGYDVNDVDAAREYVEAMLEFILYSHRLYSYMTRAHAHEVEMATERHEH